MTDDLDHRSFRAAVEREIEEMEEARAGLRPDSHLVTLCNVVVEQLRACLPRDISSAGDPGSPARHAEPSPLGAPSQYGAAAQRTTMSQHAARPTGAAQLSTST